jgi:hypothetical protein
MYVPLVSLDLSSQLLDEDEWVLASNSLPVNPKEEYQGGNRCVPYFLNIERVSWGSEKEIVHKIWTTVGLRFKQSENDVKIPNAISLIQ